MRVQAGAQPVSRVQLICELQRDWVRADTAAEFAQILFGEHTNAVRGEA
jgi:hypothetical protein